MSRMRILSLLAAFAVLALALVACGSDDGGGDGGASDADPQAVLDATFAQTGQPKIESADLDLSLDISVEGDSPGSLTATLSGPIDSSGDEFPRFDLTATASGEGDGQSLDFEGGATSTGDAAYVSYDGEDYEVDAATFGLISSSYESASSQAEGQPQSTAGLSLLKDALTGLENEGTEDVDGTETAHVSGEVDVAELVKAIGPLAEQASALGGAGAAAGIPTEAELAQLQSAVRSATFDVWSGTGDDILRRIAINLEIEAPGGAGSAMVDFDITLGDVNGDVAIDAPSDAQPLTELFSKLGVDPPALGAVGGLGGLGGLDSGSGSGSSGGGGSGDPGSGSGELGSPGDDAVLDCLADAKNEADVVACAELQG